LKKTVNRAWRSGTSKGQNEPGGSVFPARNRQASPLQPKGRKPQDDPGVFDCSFRHKGRLHPSLTQSGHGIVRPCSAGQPLTKNTGRIQGAPSSARAVSNLLSPSAMRETKGFSRIAKPHARKIKEFYLPSGDSKSIVDRDEAPTEKVGVWEGRGGAGCRASRLEIRSSRMRTFSRS